MSHDLFVYGIEVGLGVLAFLAGVALVLAPVLLAAKLTATAYDRARFHVLTGLRRRRARRAEVARRQRMVTGNATIADHLHNIAGVNNRLS